MAEQEEIIREGVRSPTEGEMQWKTVEKQKEKLGEALKITMTGHLTVLLEAAKASEEKEEKLRKELDGANILEKRGVKDRIKEEEEKRARLAAWGISCQGLEHWMREPVEEEAQVPVNLMGRDLLIKLGAVIMCGPDGLTVTLKDGTQLPCVATGTRGQWLLSEDIDRTAEIYWARLTTSNGILAHFQLWRPWIMALDVYAPPIDPYHYRHSPQAEEGIAETIEGLLRWGVGAFHVSMEHAYFASGKAWHRGQQLRYTRLPQGFALSPGIFNQVLKQTLEPCVMPAGCTLVQYVDDLLIAAPTADACFQATMTVLRRLAEAGFKFYITGDCGPRTGADGARGEVGVAEVTNGSGTSPGGQVH
ncbi:uncharacterized protein LOC109200940 [Oreochromis niloticus]|uniref:uncharacterized protein LOC109200940 n=1 Tax=Oreochromis niloticus TaxID=8128 RepID=UPI000DF1C9E6|nr:uncharacterized protein LOC109200940 [Oreochromis niloticus]